MVAHPLMLRVIAAAKKKNGKIDAAKIADGFDRDPEPAPDSALPRPGASAAVQMSPFDPRISKVALIA
jgi:hypothetical protein